MAIQGAVEVDLQYIKEVTWGITPSSPDMIQQRRVSSTLSLAKDTFQSNEARTDRNISDFRHGVCRVQGDVVGEMSLDAWNDFIEAAMGGTWDTEISKSETDFTSMAADNTASTFTAGSGSWITELFMVGDIIAFTNLSEAANNAVNYIITALTATVATVSPKPTTMSADTVFEVVRTGKKVLIGTTKRSFTIEQQYPGITQYQVFLGCRVNTLALSLPPTGMFGITCGIMGKDQNALSGTALDTTPTAVPSNDILAAVNGTLTVDGTNIAVITGLDISLDNGIQGEAVVGQNTVPDLLSGRANASGNMTAFFENATLMDAFINETALKIHVMIEEPTGTPGGFMSMSLNNVKLGGADLSIQGEGGVVLTMPFQALLPPTTSGVDVSALTIQRSSTT